MNNADILPQAPESAWVLLNISAAILILQSALQKIMEGSDKASLIRPGSVNATNGKRPHGEAQRDLTPLCPTGHKACVLTGSWAPLGWAGCWLGSGGKMYLKVQLVVAHQGSEDGTLAEQGKWRGKLSLPAHTASPGTPHLSLTETWSVLCQAETRSPHRQYLEKASFEPIS